MLGVAGIVALFAFTGDPSGPERVPSGLAPAFDLPTTDGRSVSLADYRGENVLLYFNEGVGCDACFYQMVELEENSDALDRLGVSVIPIAVNRMEDVQRQLADFGLRIPWAVDESKEVSAAYGVLGTGMHAGLPGHSFVLIDGSGKILWDEAYPSMFVKTRDLLEAMGPSLS